MAVSSKPLGFFDLPREIRDEIYRHYFSGSYSVPENVEIRDTFTLLQDSYTRGPEERHIFEVNKAVREESEASLYRHASFEMASNTQRLGQEIANRMFDVRFFTDLDHLLDSGTCSCDSALRKFSGNGITRKSCRINIDGWQLPCFMISCFFHTLKTLIGFETIIIELKCQRSSFDYALRVPLPHGRRKPKWPLLEPPGNKLLSLYEVQREEFRAGLEPTLGSGEIYDQGLARFLEFHPLRHLSKQSG